LPIGIVGIVIVMTLGPEADDGLQRLNLLEFASLPSVAFILMNGIGGNIYLKN
jgi:hypothetical protein